MPRETSTRCRAILSLALTLAAALPLAGQEARGGKFALVVGVQEYGHANFQNLEFAVRDATELARFLERQGYRVTLLTDKAATLAHVRGKLADLVRKRTRGDLVLVALAGHGLLLDDASYFCPADAEPADAKSMLPVAEVYDRLKECGAGARLLLVDACRNDPVRGVRRRGVDAAPNAPAGVGALFSCSAGQFSFETREYRHGVFFYHVLKGLEGKARSRKGQVTWDSLRAYVKEEMAEDVPRLFPGARQVPNESGNLSAIPVLVEARRADGAADGSAWRKVRTFRHADRVLAVALSADGRRLLTGSADRTAALWDADSGKRLKTFRHEGHVFAVALSADGRRLLTGSADRTAALWDADSGKWLQTFKHDGKIAAAALSGDGGRVLTGSGDKAAAMWDADSGRRLQAFPQDALLWTATVSRDGLRVLTGSGDKTAALWDADSGRRIQTYRHDDWVSAVQLHQDGRRVLTGSLDKTAVLWEADSGKKIQTFRHDDWVLSVALSADGRHVLTGSRDKACRLWQAASGNCLQTFRHEDAVAAVAFGFDGRRVLTGSSDGTAVLWEARTGE